MDPMRSDDSNEAMIGRVALVTASIFVIVLAMTYVISVHDLVASAIR